MIRKVDRLGRVVMPKEWRDHAGISELDEVEMSYNENTKEMTVKRARYRPECAFCGNQLVDMLLKYKEGIVCNECLQSIRKGINEDAK